MDHDGSLARRRFGRVHLAGSFKCARDLDTEVAKYRRARLSRVVVEKMLKAGGTSFSASENGVLIFRRGLSGRQLTWFDRNGKPLGTAGDGGSIFSPRISPDQKSVVFFQSDGMSTDIWLFDGERGNTTRFTVGADNGIYPVWSPNGSRIAYYTRRSNEALVIERPDAGMGKETVLYRSTGMAYYPQSWSRDGRWLLLMTLSSGPFYLLPVDAQGSGGEPKLIPFPESHGDRNPSISPDGHWLLYSSTQTGIREVFVESMPEQTGGLAAGAKQKVSIAGGTQPAWRADGKELFYVAADGKMMSVWVRTGYGQNWYIEQRLARQAPASPEVSTKRSSRGPNMLFAGCGFGRLARY